MPGGWCLIEQHLSNSEDSWCSVSRPPTCVARCLVTTDSVKGIHIEWDKSVAYKEATKIVRLVQAIVEEEMELLPSLPAFYHPGILFFGRPLPVSLHRHRKLDDPINVEPGKTDPWHPIYSLPGNELDVLPVYWDKCWPKGRHDSPSQLLHPKFYSCWNLTQAVTYAWITAKWTRWHWRVGTPCNKCPNFVTGWTGQESSPNRTSRTGITSFLTRKKTNEKLAFALVMDCTCTR